MFWNRKLPALSVYVAEKTRPLSGKRNKTTFANTSGSFKSDTIPFNVLFPPENPGLGSAAARSKMSAKLRIGFSAGQRTAIASKSFNTNKKLAAALYAGEKKLRA